MAFEFRLPDIGEGLEDAEIVSWYVSPGDVVERDQALLEVLTDKASSELPSPVAGKVLKLSGQEGEKIKVGDVLIQIEEANSNSSQETSTEEVSKEIVEVEVWAIHASGRRTPGRSVEHLVAKAVRRYFKHIAKRSIQSGLDEHEKNEQIEQYLKEKEGNALNILRENFTIESNLYFSIQ